MGKTNDLEKLQEASVKKLTEFFTGASAVRESPIAIKTANLAVSALSAVGRLKATDRARDATQLLVLRNISENKAEFKTYIKASMPHLNPRIEG